MLLLRNQTVAILAGVFPIGSNRAFPAARACRSLLGSRPSFATRSLWVSGRLREKGSRLPVLASYAKIQPSAQWEIRKR